MIVDDSFGYCIDEYDVQSQRPKVQQYLERYVTSKYSE